MLGYDAFGDRESQAGAASVQTGRHEGVEDIGQHVGGNAGAVILHRDGDARGAVAVRATGRDYDFARRRNFVNGVAQQIDEHLDQAVGVGGDPSSGMTWLA